MLSRTKPFICWLAVEFQLTNLITDKKNECRIFQLVVHFTQFSHFNETKPLEIGTTKEKAFANYSVFKVKLVYKADFPHSQRPTSQIVQGQILIGHILANFGLNHRFSQVPLYMKSWIKNAQ